MVSVLQKCTCSKITYMENYHIPNDRQPQAYNLQLQAISIMHILHAIIILCMCTTDKCVLYRNVLQVPQVCFDINRLLL